MTVLYASFTKIIWAAPSPAQYAIEGRWQKTEFCPVGRYHVAHSEVDSYETISCWCVSVIPMCPYTPKPVGKGPDGLISAK